MKTCTKCGETKPLDHYSKSSIHKDGRRPSCKSCDAAYYALRRERKVAEVRQYRAANKATISARRKKKVEAKHARWRAAKDADHDCHVRLFWYERRKWTSESHRLRNKPYYAAAASKRRAVARQAEPVWADDAFILFMYTTRQYLTQETGEEWHVDHIVPLQGRNVCGLHVHFNLRVIPAKDNLSKSNHFQTN